MHCLHPDAVVEAAANFVAGFPGDVLYAVKCNPDPAVLLAVWDGGVRHFDCASAPEVALVRRLLPDAAIHFMHPVKSRLAIRAAWAAGVRDFSLDHPDELADSPGDWRRRRTWPVRPVGHAARPRRL